MEVTNILRFIFKNGGNVISDIRDDFHQFFLFVGLMKTESDDPLSITFEVSALDYY